MQEKNSSGTEIARTDYSYNSYKQLQTETRSFNGLSGTYSVGYDYNYAGALKQISYAADFPSPVTDWSKSVNYDYNYAGGATTVGTSLRSGSTTNNVVTAFDYRAWGGLQKADFANGRRLALSYDQKRSQLSNLQLRKTDNTDVVSNLSYDYYNGGNNNGRIQKITDADSSYTTTFGYDDYNRLSSASASAYTRSYSYDNWGNLTGVTSTGAGESGSYSLSYAANGSGAPSTNRISNSGYTFDSAGNITNDGALAYTYDAASRLKTAGGDAYQYDGDGHRVRNQVNGYSNALYYLWSSVLNQPVVEIDSTTPSVFRAYVYGSGGQILAVQSYDANFYWLHTDVLSSGRKMTDSSGAVTYRAEYDPHGQMVFESATGGSLYLYLNSHKFTGYERDWSTNLNNAKARTYNHNRARFMQPDPLSLGASDVTNPQSLNLYSYVQNDPINFVDPEGLNLMDPDYWEKNQTLFGNGNGGSGRGIFSPGIHSYSYWSQVSMRDVSGTFYFPAQYHTGVFVMGGSVGYTGGGMTAGGSGGGGINSPSVNREILSRLGTKLKKLIPRVCGGGGFGYGGVGGGVGPVHAEALALVQYDSQEGGSHGGLMGAGAGHFTFGVESMRTWKDWQAHTSPIALGGIEVKGATRVFGKKVNTQSRDIGGLVQYENGQLSLGIYAGATLTSKRTFGGGAYVTLSWRGCHE